MPQLQASQAPFNPEFLTISHRAQTNTAKHSARPIKQLIKAVCFYFNVTQAQLMGPDRERNNCRARAAFAHICRHSFNYTLAHTGQLLNRHHSTVIHLLTRVEDEQFLDKLFQQNISRIQQQLQNA